MVDFEWLWQSDKNPWLNPNCTDPEITQWTPYDLSETYVLEKGFVRKDEFCYISNYIIDLIDMK